MLKDCAAVSIRIWMRMSHNLLETNTVRPSISSTFLVPSENGHTQQPPPPPRIEEPHRSPPPNNNSSSKMSDVDWAAINEKLPFERTDEAKEKRRELFKQFDPNGNGYLSLAEVSCLKP